MGVEFKLNIDNERKESIGDLKVYWLSIIDKAERYYQYMLNNHIEKGMLIPSRELMGDVAWVKSLYLLSRDEIETGRAGVDDGGYFENEREIISGPASDLYGAICRYEDIRDSDEEAREIEENMCLSQIVT